MSDAISVEIPFISIHDNVVKLTAWLVREGDEVSRGQDIAEVKTSKSAAEIVAPVSGKIHLKSAAGDELTAGSVIAYIGAAVPWIASIESAAVMRMNKSVTTPLAIVSTKPKTRFTRRALELLERHGLSTELFDGAKFVREQDILDHIERASAASPDTSELHDALNGVTVGNLTFPLIFANRESGKLDPAFLKALQRSSESFARLRSERKCRIYRDHGAKIGEDVVIGKDTILIAPTIQIEDRVRLGDNSSLILRERLAIGALSSFREGLIVRAGTAVFGANTIAGSRIQIAGAGHSDPSSLLVVGDNVSLGDDVLMDISRPILIGKQVCLRQRSILTTHSDGHFILEGDQNTLSSIVLEDFSEVGMNATVEAGSRIGRSAIVSPNSYVLTSVPEGKLAMGVPAQVIRDVARPMERVNQVQIAEGMFYEFQKLLSSKGLHVSPVRSRPFLHFKAEYHSQSMCLIFMEHCSTLSADLHHAGETVVWTFEASPRNHRSDVTYMDLLGKRIYNATGTLAEMSCEFLSQHGIRLEPDQFRPRASHATPM